MFLADLSDKTLPTRSCIHPSSFGVVTWFKLQQRYNHILSKLFLGRRQDSNFTRFTSLLETSLFDEDGIRYTLPDHVYAEESTTW